MRLERIPETRSDVKRKNYIGRRARVTCAPQTLAACSQCRGYVGGRQGDLTQQPRRNADGVDICAPKAPGCLEGAVH